MTTVPVINTNRGFKVWLRKDIYDGPNKPGKEVPNIDDMVIDWDTGVWRVIAVDHYKTNMSFMVRTNLSNLGGGASESDKAVLTNLASNSNPFRIYVDTTVVPHTLTFDSRWVRFGSHNTHVKVFRGTDTSAKTGVVISSILNAAGNIVSEDIPLENVIIPNIVNVSQKTPKMAHCSETVNNGEEAMVVTYTADGRITSIDKFIIVTTNFTRTTDQHSKYVSKVELLSPFLSKTDKRLIECPINMVSQSLALTAKVSYTDGTHAILPIDGRKITLAGFKTFVASQIGQTVDLVLVYHLSDQELALSSTPSLPDRRITVDYRLKTIDVNSFYDVKIYCVPTWSNGRYDLKFYLYNLERDSVIDITNQIEFGVGDTPFNPTKYNVTQNLRVAFNMQQLGSKYSYYRQTQHIAVTLKSPATTTGVTTYYTVAYSDANVYGENIKLYFGNDPANSSLKRINISCGYSDTLTWLANIYRLVEPIYYPAREVSPPTPTHVRIKANNQLLAEIPINRVISDIDGINNNISQGQTVILEFITKENNLVQELGMASMVATIRV